MDTFYQPLQNGDTLNIFNNDELIFKSKSNWLNPLFEADAFFKESKIKYDNLSAHDTAGGKAAAALMIRFNIKKVHFNLVSELAVDILKKNNVTLVFDKKIDELLCMTESILKDEDDVNKIYSFLRIKAKRVSGLDIDLKDLTLGYNNKVVYRDFNLNLKAGETVVIQGENGIGKTTLIKTLLGEIPPFSGSIKIDNKSIFQLEKGTIGYIKQEKESQSFPTSVEEVVSMGIKNTKDKKEVNYIINTSLRKCKAFHLKNRNYYTLSGGEKQRVSIARCLAQKARILIFDEPTSFLDKDSEKELVNLLKTLGTTQMPTILCVTHDQMLIDNLNWKVCKMERADV